MAPKTHKSKIVDAHRKRVKIRMVEAFGGKCGICSYSRCIHALEFHHLNPSEKEFSFGRKWSRAWDTTKAELMKCILLCSNCHKEYHAGILDIPEDVPRFNENLITTSYQYHRKHTK